MTIKGYSKSKQWDYIQKVNAFGFAKQTAEKGTMRRLHQGQIVSAKTRFSW